MFNVFIDPAATAKAVRAPLAWLWPLILCAAAVVFAAMWNAPVAVSVLSNHPPSNLPREQVDQMVNRMSSQKFTPITVPLVLTAELAALAAMVMVTFMIFDIRPKYRDVFAMMCTCELIDTLGKVAGAFVVHAKGDDQTFLQTTMPSLGLDIFFPDLKGPLFAVLNYFSLFKVWYLVILVLAMSYLTGSSKGKAIVAVTPVWFFGLLAWLGLSFVMSRLS